MERKWNKQIAKRWELKIIRKHLQSACYTDFYMYFKLLDHKFCRWLCFFWFIWAEKSSERFLIATCSYSPSSGCLLYVCLYTFTCLTYKPMYPFEIRAVKTFLKEEEGECCSGKQTFFFLHNNRFCMFKLAFTFMKAHTFQYLLLREFNH